ncbi:MAG TPA: hypothetical protein VMZ03_05880, partial [Chitinophagaceae bacterium]|nr:hypothetical protein [Chitinophagaceae bacterium]
SSLSLLPAYPKDEKINAKEFFESDAYFDKMSKFLDAGHTMNIVILKQDSLLNKGMIITTSQNNYSFKKGIKFKEVRTDTTYPGDSIDNTFIKFGGGAKYTDKILPGNLYWKFIGLVFLLILYVTMVYGPIAAFLVEMFPTKIRYTSMSLPYHIGNGVFGGLVPFIGVLLTTTYPADPLVGLWYPIGVAILCLLIGTMYLTNRIDKNVRD